jgi:hypothetical protein
MRRAPLACAALFWGTIVVFAAHSSAVHAQDAVLEAGEDVPTQDAVLNAGADEPDQKWIFFGDFWGGYDHVTGIPNNRDDVSRVRGRVRLGGLWNFAEGWDAVGVMRVAQGSDSNSDNRRNNDNERSDEIGLDQLLLRWRPGENTTLQLGKMPQPLELSPMVWDNQLRPAGISIDQSIPLGEFDRLQFVGGYFAGQHLYGDESRIAAAQLAWRWHEGAPTRFTALLSYADFDDLDELTLEGLARTNTIVNGKLVNDYRLLDLQLSSHFEIGHWPIDVLGDAIHNLGAKTQRNGGRISVIAGDHTKARGWEFGYAYQRIQRDAVMAAFNSDDWWFHSAVRGDLAWIGYGINANWAVRVAGFHELRDGLHEYTDRLRIDVNAHW